MSAFSTIHITRGKARQILMNRIFHATDNDLGNLLDEELEKRLYTCRIVEDGSKNGDNLI